MQTLHARHNKSSQQIHAITLPARQDQLPVTAVLMGDGGHFTLVNGGFPWNSRMEALKASQHKGAEAKVTAPVLPKQNQSCLSA
jgi:hypothetical protein